MPERFTPRSEEGKVARTLETVAAKEFGPEKLKRGDVARCLNLQEDEMTNEEWSEISEFAVNAGSDIMRAAIARDFPEVLRPTDAARLNERLEKNEDSLIPFHDLFHAAEIYRLNQGKTAATQFIAATPRERYVDPQVLAAELYPLLFLADPWMGKPMPVLLHSSEGRKKISDFFSQNTNLPAESKHKIRDLLSVEDQNQTDRRYQYENLVETVLLGNAAARIPDLTSQEKEDIQTIFQQTLKNPPAHYDAFARRIFDREWETNPRLFLDELLEDIRTKPE